MKTSFDGGPKDGGPEFVSGPPPVLGPLRTCTKCGEVKTLDEYSKHPRGRFGTDGRCKSCRKSAEKKRYAENKTEYNQRRRDRYAGDPEYRQKSLDWFRDWYRDYYAKNRQKYIEAAQARRALKAGAKVSPVDLADLWTGYCALCGEVLDYDLKYPDPLSKSLDHATPLSLGGAHSKENLQWTHLTCNLTKGARI